MATLYELAENWLKVMQLAEEGADEEAVANALEDIGGEIEDKADGYAKVIKSLEAEAAAIKSETDRLFARKTAMENSAKNLKKRLESTMIACGKTKFRTLLFSFGIQKNAPSVQIEDESGFVAWAQSQSPELIKTKIEINKKELIAQIKSGVEIDGVQLILSESLRIR